MCFCLPFFGISRLLGGFGFFFFPFILGSELDKSTFTDVFYSFKTLNCNWLPINSCTVLESACRKQRSEASLDLSKFVRDKSVFQLIRPVSVSDPTYY